MRLRKKTTIAGHSTISFEDALKDATKGKGAGWYKLVETKVKDDGRPHSITDYHVQVIPTEEPPLP
jgi:hypothetical protein